MSMFGGTISPFIMERGEYGLPTLREPTADELAKMEVEHAERQRQRDEWEAERPERERLEAKREAKRESEQRAHLAECDKAFPVAGVSGEYGDWGNGVFLEAWPSDAVKLYPRVIKFVVDKCDFCDAETQVLEVANAADEYSYQSVCRACLGKMFDAFGGHGVSE